MKLLIVAIAFVSYSITIFGQDNLKTVATQLHMRIGSILVNLSTIERNVKNQLKDIETSDFGLANNFKILQVKHNLDKKHSHPGIEECNKTYNDTMESLKSFFRNIARKQLSVLEINTDRSIQLLTYIQNRLIGPALDQEINACHKTPQNCNVTGNYTNTANVAEKSVNAGWKDLTSPDLKMKEINKLGPQVITTKIRDTVLTPVSNCINKH